jgi:Pentapeptide repeats (8 copies)
VNRDNGQMRDTLIGVALLVGLVSVALSLAGLSGLKWYLSPDNALSIVERRDLVQGLASAGQALAVFLTGAVGLIGLFFTWQNTRQARASTLRTLQLTEQGQITERFTRAVEQLGAREGDEKIMEMRIGGIYALERISRESHEDYWPIMELFSSYVREHAVHQPTRDSEAEDLEAEDSDEDEPSIEEPRFSHKHPDIQAIMTVIGRRSLSYREEPRRIVLNHTDLSWTWLFEANLAGVFLWEAHAPWINADSANFEQAILRFANLAHSLFINANFTNANLTHANLERSNLTRANLAGAKLESTNLAGANLTGALGLRQGQIDVADGDQSTRLPDGFTRPVHWPTNVREADEDYTEKGRWAKFASLLRRGRRTSAEADRPSQQRGR